MAISFSLSYLPHRHNHSATVGFSKESELNVFLQKNCDSSPLSLHLFLFMPPSHARCLPSQRTFPSHLPFPVSLFLSFHFLLMTSFPHLASPPLFSLFLCPPQSLFFLLAICSLFLSASDLSAIWWDLDWERWSIGAVQQCTQERMSGKETGPLHIKYHLTPNLLHLLPLWWEEETASIFPCLVHIGGGRSAT